ncbi:unnamed protein product [marine sediment metagenome]|uniref:Uncharacterized protein n=1 Tax=marine sediment metagenome TaxID=412755 RepID=X1JFL9_9ZZZZ
MSITENIKALCEAVNKEANSLKALTGMAGHAWWTVVDPGYAKLKQMARVQANIILDRAQALRDAVPD